MAKVNSSYNSYKAFILVVLQVQLQAHFSVKSSCVIYFSKQNIDFADYANNKNLKDALIL